MQDKPTGPRLPAAKDAAKLMQEGALAMERGQWERAERRLMAAWQQLRQLDPASWPLFQAGHLVMELRLAQGQREAAAQVARQQYELAEKLQGAKALESALGDLMVILDAGTGNAGEELGQALARLRGLIQTNLSPDHGITQLNPQAKAPSPR